MQALLEYLFDQPRIVGRLDLEAIPVGHDDVAHSSTGNIGLGEDFTPQYANCVIEYIERLPLDTDMHVHSRVEWL